MQGHSAEQLRNLADQYRGLLSAEQRQVVQAIRLTDAKSVSAPSPVTPMPAQDGASNRERLRTLGGPQPGPRGTAHSADRQELGQLKPAQTPAAPKRNRDGLGR